MSKIKKVVIPAAGMGTRFLPATKAQPKEMMPVVDKPIIQYVVEEAVASGIEDIVIITGWHKRSIEDHFDYPFELEKRLEEAGKTKQLEEIRKVAAMANFIYIRQKGPYGNGTPVLNAKEVIGNEPFAVLWGDEFIHSKPPRLKQMIDVYDKYEDCVISGVRIPDKSAVSKYGIADYNEVDEGVFEIKKIIEKPDPDKAPSNLAVHGAYIFNPEIFDYLENTKPGKDNELWLVDAVNDLMKKRAVYACEIKNSKYYDTGNKLEYLKANIDFALENRELSEGLKKYLKEILK